MESLAPGVPWCFNGVCKYVFGQKTSIYLNTPNSFRKDLPKPVPWYFSPSFCPIAGTDDKCSVTDDEREDCGYHGVTPNQCKEMGCCWKPAKRPNKPWCFHSKGRGSQIFLKYNTFTLSNVKLRHLQLHVPFQERWLYSVEHIFQQYKLHSFLSVAKLPMVCVDSNQFALMSIRGQLAGKMQKLTVGPGW